MEKRKLLLIEDSDDHAELTEFYIKDYCSAVEVARLRDGAEAMVYIEQTEQVDTAPLPWLVLLDLKLPKYDGHEILMRLKGSRHLAKVPVVIFSTSNSSKDIEQALNNHANSYIVKPMEPDRYGEVINEVLSYWQLNEHYLLYGSHQTDA